MLYFFASDSDTVYPNIFDTITVRWIYCLRHDGRFSQPKDWTHDAWFPNPTLTEALGWLWGCVLCFRHIVCLPWKTWLNTPNIINRHLKKSNIIYISELSTLFSFISCIGKSTAVFRQGREMYFRIAVSSTAPQVSFA